MSVSALVDTTVLSNFAHIQRPELLHLAMENLGVAPSVRRELDQGEKLGRLPVCDWSWLEPVTLSRDEQSHVTTLNHTSGLGLGEIECLAVAQSRGWIILTDDQDARRMAKSLGLRVSGTLGVLVKLTELGILTLDEADMALSSAIRHGYRSPVASLRDLV
jgi:hypothetical protein